MDYCQRSGIVYSQFQRWYKKQSHYLESLERESYPALSDMERQDYIDQINDLKASNRRLVDMINTLKQTLDSVTASKKRNEELAVRLTVR